VAKVLYRKTSLTPQQRKAKAAKTRVSHLSGFVDPFPDIPGTLPEKILYAALVKRNIPFEFQESVRARIPEIKLDNTYRPDFILPDAKIIIEVQGAYWHSMPGRIDSDSFRAAVLQYLGYKVLFWWDYDILRNIDQLFLTEPILNRYPVHGAPLPHHTKWHDDSKGIRTLNREHRKPISYKRPYVKIGRRKKSKTSFNVG
jgi:G:T-mismatch repair DNA endonuclease (very short patch repair protein)